MLIHSNAALVMRNIRSLGKNVENDVPRNNQLGDLLLYRSISKSSQNDNV